MDDSLQPPHLNLVGGAWCPAASGETFEKRSPWRPDDLVGTFPASSADDVTAAVDAAAEAFPAWAALPGPQRAAVLFRAAEGVDRRVEEMARDMTREMGKPIRESRGEAARCASILRFAAGECFRARGEVFDQSLTTGSVSTVHRPLGVVGLITPWNFPAAIPAWKLAPALAYGNTVVLKLALEAPLTGLHLAACLDEAGLPAGVLNVLCGRGAVVGNAIVRDPRVRAISFTGSVATGHAVRDEATAIGKRVQLELGGHNPVIVTEDADLDRAVEGTFVGAYFSAGQKCTATRRVYVQRAVYDAFRDRLLARLERAVVGDPSDPATEVGPIVSTRQLDEVTAAVERARAEGGTIAAGGSRAHPEALLLAPTLFEGVADDAYLSCEEVFGPVAALYPYETLDEALDRANAVAFGLSASIFTGSLTAAERFEREIQAGLIHVNSQTAGAEVHVPFGGIKSSGFGPHEQGRAARDFFTESVTVYRDA